MSKATEVIEEIMNRGIEYYDNTTMDDMARLSYFNEAKQIVESDVFNNELNSYVASLVRFITYEATTIEQVHNIRTGIIVLETLKQRLKETDNPTKPIPTTETIHAGL